MPPTTQRFVPTWRNALAENALVALIGPAFVVVVFFLTRGVGSLPFALVFGAVLGVVQFAYFSYRFHRKAPRELVLDDRGLVLHGPGEQSRALEWARIEKAVHRSKGGLHWTFDSEAGSLVLRDDGFDTEQWDELTKTIWSRLDAHRVPNESEGLATAFDDES